MGFKLNHTSAVQREKNRHIHRKTISERSQLARITYDSTKSTNNSHILHSTINISNDPTMSNSSSNNQNNGSSQQEQIIKPQQQSSQIHPFSETLQQPRSLANPSIIGSIEYKKPATIPIVNTYQDTTTNTTTPASTTLFSSAPDPLKSIESQVMEIYTNEINKLQVREAFKSYLRRTLEMIINSDGSIKLHLLDIRKQLRASPSLLGGHMEPHANYTQFISFVDKLYFLAVDKQISLALGVYEPSEPISNASSRGSFNLEDILVNSRASGFLSGSSSPNIARILHMNALQRLAQTYRNRLSNLVRNRSSNRGEQIAESTIDREDEEEDENLIQSNRLTSRAAAAAAATVSNTRTTATANTTTTTPITTITATTPTFTIPTRTTTTTTTTTTTARRVNSNSASNTALLTRTSANATTVSSAVESDSSIQRAADSLIRRTRIRRISGNSARLARALRIEDEEDIHSEEEINANDEHEGVDDDDDENDEDEDEMEIEDERDIDEDGGEDNNSTFLLGNEDFLELLRIRMGALIEQRGSRPDATTSVTSSMHSRIRERSRRNSNGLTAVQRILNQFHSQSQSSTQQTAQNSTSNLPSEPGSSAASR